MAVLFVLLAVATSLLCIANSTENDPKSVWSRNVDKSTSNTCPITKENQETIEPIYHDLWGYPLNWTDPRDGWDGAKRKWWLEDEKSNLMQSQNMEQYTKLGYKKTKIPKKVYQVLHFAIIAYTLL